VLIHHSLVHYCDRCDDIFTNYVPWEAESVPGASACGGYDRFHFCPPVSFDHYSRYHHPTLLWEHWVSVSSTVFVHCINVLSFHHVTHSGWCWIPQTSGKASRLKIGTEYAYFWLAATVSLVLYGTIVVSWLREETVKRDRCRHREAISMAW
jgi:hypothetical protein